MRFPQNFTWGVATAAAQIEGAAFEDGRGASIWDVFSAIPGKIKNEGVPTVACDSYHKIERDVEMLKELGVNSYRFSFSWSRILPDGTGKVNEKGIASPEPSTSTQIRSLWIRHSFISTGRKESLSCPIRISLPVLCVWSGRRKNSGNTRSPRLCGNRKKAK
ncbi:MAG: family 1 glycosylhydrolase [Lachnospiraceae bacterium]|nr:family 1 glycosylhydrolase [Lachnospiraceae bacterium]